MNDYVIKQSGTGYHLTRDGVLLHFTDTRDEAAMLLARYQLMDKHLVPGWKKQAGEWS